MGGFILFAILALFIVLVGALIIYASRVRKVGPNEVLVISGRGDGVNKFRIVTGGRAFVWPVLERVDYLSLELMTIDIRTPDVPTVQGVPVTVDGVAQVKIGNDENSIRTAATQFLSKSNQEIRHVAHETLAGHLRAILGTLKVEELYRDREAFAQRVQEISSDDMASMGMEIVSFVIKDVNDAEGYLEALGRPRIAEVKRDAEIGEAEAARDAAIKAAQARQLGESAKYVSETKIAESEKEYEVQQAVYQAEMNRQKAQADLAFTLQENITQQEIMSEQVQISVVQKQKQIEVQEQEALRKEKELEATIRKPADAERYKLQTLAEAQKFQVETEAQGQAEATKQRGEAEADANRATGLAQAEVIREQGLAQAEVIRQQGLAEAEATQAKAEAWSQYTQAAIIQQLIDALPQVASAIAQPLAKTDKIVVINNGSDGGAGASKITQDVTNIVAQVPATLEALTGVDLNQAIKMMPGMNFQTPSSNGTAKKVEAEVDGEEVSAEITPPDTNREA